MVTAVADFRVCPALDKNMPGEAVDAGALFESYHDRIYRYVLRMVREAGEAEDLTQETFLRAHRRGDSLRDPLAARGWLYRIATHVCLDRLRQRKPEVALDAAEGEKRPPTVPAGRTSVEEIAERKETSACVQRCLDYLPDTYRAVLLLHEAHSLTAAEIASLLGVRVTTVKIRLHRARRKLRKVMEYGCSVTSDSKGTPVCEPKQRPAEKCSARREG